MTNSLDRLLENAQKDSRYERAFFRALLETIVYAHIPITDRIDNGRIRFIQFHRPENGQLVLPFFTDEKKSRVAEGTTVRSVALSGREFFEITRGATLMMNPNDHRCVLYPEEIATLLQAGEIATIAEFTPGEENSMAVGVPMEAPPAWLLEALLSAARDLLYIERVYVAAIYDTSDAPRQISFLAAICAEKGNGERAMHAINNAIQPLCRSHGGPSVDLMYFEISDETPSWVTGLALDPCYDRTPMAHTHCGDDAS
jgi:SseB protein N-terminal domain